MNIEGIKNRLAINEIACEDDLIDLSPDVKYLLSIIEQDTRFFEKVEEWKSFSKENVLQASINHMKAIRGN